MSITSANERFRKEAAYNIPPGLQSPVLAAACPGSPPTGIGSFYDDEVHRYLNLGPEQGQVVYHFAIGSPVPDPRLEG
jgi:hypothetical protein